MNGKRAIKRNEAGRCPAGHRFCAARGGCNQRPAERRSAKADAAERD